MPKPIPSPRLSSCPWLAVLFGRLSCKLLLRWALLCLSIVPARAYSVFTHEHLIDLTWNTTLRPLLLARYPGAGEDVLRRAHAYAYGGCVIQDLGYYPFGETLFSDLTHYVRSGDFVNSLLTHARDIDEYAFALGALSHYVGDTIGHHDAINRATALAFPGLSHRYGPYVTYDENPHAHIRTEFGFDVDQLSKHNLAPGAYLRYIGLRVSRRLLDEAFLDTYALPLPDILGTRRPSFQSYRWAVRSFLPRIAYAESYLHQGQFLAEPAGDALDRYQAALAKADFQSVWNQYRRKPGFRTKFVAFLISILPKVGPLANAVIRIPTDETEQLYLESVNRTITSYCSFLTTLQKGRHASINLPNRDLDTGDRSRPGDYPLTDQTYARLLHRLAQDPPDAIPADLKSDILGYYSDPNAPISTKSHARRWRRVQNDLVKLSALPVTAAAAVGQP